jgi:cytochrome oxidase Cu insertion factor (SCO1/SenC/PrrC family)
MKACNWKRMAVALALGAATLLPGGMAQAALGVGDKAPDFALPATTAKQVSSKDFAGKTLVLFFYTGAFTNA